MSIYRGDGGSGDANNNVTINEVENLRSEAVQARDDAQTAGTNAENAQAYSEEWANKAEDSLVSTDAGGDGVDDYSALHWSFKAEDEKIAAELAKTAAELAETNAEAAKTAAALSESNAATSESNAATSESNALTSANNAATSETNASNSASAAATSETNAASSANAASTSETNAANSASAASTSETNAASSESAASTSASNAATSETNAANSASAASTSESNAAASATEAGLTLVEFETQYLGAYASDPATDNEGDPLIDGAIYRNTAVPETRIYNLAAGLWEPLADLSKATTAEAEAGTDDEAYMTALKTSQAISALTSPPAHSYNKQTREDCLFELDGSAVQTSQALSVVVDGVLLDVSALTAVTLPTLSSHTDYKIWIDNQGALSAVEWDDPDPADSRWIGGFHARHTDADVNEHSLWDLGYRPICSPRAMVISPDKKVWWDIYLMDTEYGLNGYSRGNAQIADDGDPPIIPDYYGGNGTATYGAFEWWHAVDLSTAAGKRLPWYQEFTAAAYGVVENSARGTDPVTTGKDADFRSAIGCEQITGCLYQWGADIAATDGSSWTDIADGRGQVYASNIKAVRFGADWLRDSQAGSRASDWNYAPDTSFSVFSSRAVCDHIIL